MVAGALGFERAVLAGFGAIVAQIGVLLAGAKAVVQDLAAVAVILVIVGVVRERALAVGIGFGVGAGVGLRCVENDAGLDALAHFVVVSVTGVSFSHLDWQLLPDYGIGPQASRIKLYPAS